MPPIDNEQVSVSGSERKSHVMDLKGTHGGVWMSPPATGWQAFLLFNQALFTFPASPRWSDGKIVECEPRIFHQLLCARLNFFSLYLEYLGWHEALKKQHRSGFCIDYRTSVSHKSPKLRNSKNFIYNILLKIK